MADKYLFAVLGTTDEEMITNRITEFTESGEYELVSMTGIGPAPGMVSAQKVLIVFRGVDPLFKAAQRLAEAYLRFGPHYEAYFNDAEWELRDAWLAYKSLREK